MTEKSVVSNVTREDYEEAVGVLDRLRERAMAIADEIEGRSCYPSEFELAGVSYTYHISGSEYGGVIPVEWLFADDWRPLHVEAKLKRVAEQARLKAETDAKTVEDREARDRKEFERLREKYGWGEMPFA